MLYVASCHVVEVGLVYEFTAISGEGGNNYNGDDVFSENIRTPLK